MTALLQRTSFSTSRALDFCSSKELTAQCGHEPKDWPLVVLKELVDNALDACEEAGTAPEIAVQVDERGITVADNGPGLPAEVIKRVLDFSVRVSSREAYIAPDRGAQGNALKTLVAMPFVLDGRSGAIEIEARGVRHEITFKVDPIRQLPVIDHRQQAGLVKIGSRVTVRWPDSSSPILAAAKERFLLIANDYAWLNPHLTLSVDWFGRLTTVEAVALTWKKWRSCDPTSVHWYEAQHLERLVAAYLAHDNGGGRERLVRDFITEFRGLSATGKRTLVLESTGLSRARLSVLCSGDGLDAELIRNLLKAMQANSAPVKPEQLGIIGKEHLQQRFEAAGCQMESFRYKRVVGGEDGVPWVMEAAFGWCPEAYIRRLVTGVNWSTAIGSPFRVIDEERTVGGDVVKRRVMASLEGVLADQSAGPLERVIMFLHLAHPRAEFTDRGKSAIASSTLDGPALTDLVKSVTAKWAKKRKREKGEDAAYYRRRDAEISSTLMDFKEAAYFVMERAYMKASANGTLPAAARQIMYAARGEIQDLTDKDLDDRYFTQTLLPAFMADHPELTANWRVAWDPRGHFIEPHTAHSVPLGTLAVDGYMNRLCEPHWSFPSVSMGSISTSGPSGRYGAVLFVEKEGFAAVFNAARLAERYDIAIMSTKGISNTSARRLVDTICSQYNIPLFVLHDFDVSGFTILRTLRQDTVRYQFENAIEVVDLGLRLDDVHAWELESEDVKHKNFEAYRAQLLESNATADEIGFLEFRRVELNAFTSDKLIEWIETKLQEHGVCKVIPDHKTLAEEYRRQHQSAYLRKHFDELLECSRKDVEDLEVPASLGDEVARLLEDEPALSWNQAVAEIARRCS